MATMTARLLRLADDLVEQGRQSSALRRRAISTAYYAVFHAIAKVCAEVVLGDHDQTSDNFIRVYRALDHGPLKNAWENKDSPLQKNADLKKIGNLVVPIQSERIRADYLPPLPHPFTYSKSRAIVQQARLAVDALDSLSSDDRRTLAIGLLFAKRRSS